MALWISIATGPTGLETWMGSLEKIHCLTTRDSVELRIEFGNGTTPSVGPISCSMCKVPGNGHSMLWHIRAS